jgi:hypothetical protein
LPFQFIALAKGAALILMGPTTSSVSSVPLSTTSRSLVWQAATHSSEANEAAGPREIKVVVADVARAVDRLRVGLLAVRDGQHAAIPALPAGHVPTLGAGQSDPLERLAKLKQLLDAGALSRRISRSRSRGCVPSDLFVSIVRRNAPLAAPPERHVRHVAAVSASQSTIVAERSGVSAWPPWYRAWRSPPGGKRAAIACSIASASAE